MIRKLKKIKCYRALENSDLSKRICKSIRFVAISPAGLRNFFLMRSFH